jgi:hypothetical protein
LQAKSTAPEVPEQTATAAIANSHEFQNDGESEFPELLHTGESVEKVVSATKL